MSEDFACVTKTIKAAHYTLAGGWRAPHLIVIHTTEGRSGPGSAAAVANWFAGKSAPQASAHVIAGCDDVVRAVADNDVAWAAPGANQFGLQLEITGRAAWSPEEWLQHTDILRNAAKVVAAWSDKYSLPIRKLDANEVQAGLMGVCGHVDVSKAFKRSDHWDPGEFVWDEFLAMVVEELTDAPPP